MKNKAVSLIVLDGFGASTENKGNAILSAKMPFFDYLLSNFPKTLLFASGGEVGLPWGDVGNSEVGHLNLGSGRVVMQDLLRIKTAIEKGDFYKNKAFLKACDFVKEHHSTLHILGLVSDGGVHSHIEHLLALLDLARIKKVPKVAIHVITDGRDTPQKAAEKYLRQLLPMISKIGMAKVATVCGRYFAMDRDHRWERTKASYDLLVYGKGLRASDPFSALKLAYKAGQSDEFISPTVISENGKDAAKISENDAVIFFNFRPDRALQITKAFVESEFSAFAVKKFSSLLFVTMTNYEEDLKTEVAFSSLDLSANLEHYLAQVLSENGLSQLHIAETEKYAHVTYFFNAGREPPLPLENRILIPSLKIKTYDLKPEMSAGEITEKAIFKISQTPYSFVLINYANPDMVGHTGNFKATVSALEFLDNKLKEYVQSFLKLNGTVIITADHGNCEQMINLLSGDPDKEHTTNPVPFILVDLERKISGGKSSKEEFFASPPAALLADVAPTILEILGIQKPPVMSGSSLLDVL